MRLRSIFLGIAIPASAVLLAYVLTVKPGNRENREPNHPPMPALPAAAVPDILPQEAIVHATGLAAADGPDFEFMPEHQRRAAITILEGNPSLDAPVIAHLAHELGNRRLDDVSRHKIANCLVNQRHHDAALYQRFIAMIADPAESPTWREFSVQQLSRTYAFAADKQTVVDTLLEIMEHGHGSLCGTAMLMLHRLDQGDLVHLDQRFYFSLTRYLRDPHADPLTRSTIIGIIGERRLAAHAPAIRELAHGDDPTMKRVSIAALGYIGTPNEDIDYLKICSHDVDRSIAAAAEAAIRRLNEMQKKDLAHP